jgi:hypothetical protein
MRRPEGGSRPTFRGSERTRAFPTPTYTDGVELNDRSSDRDMAHYFELRLMEKVTDCWSRELCANLIYAF